MNSSEIAYIILSFALTATFISIFFFTYVSQVESDIIKTQITDSIEGFVSATNLFLTPEQKKNIGKTILASLTPPDMSKQDAEASETNNKLIHKSIIVFSTIVSVAILIIIILWYNYRFEMIDIVKYSLIILSLVAVTETLFVTFITKNYRLLDDHYLSYLIIKNLNSYAG